MLVIRNDIKPSLNLYYIGAQILVALQESGPLTIDNILKQLNYSDHNITVNHIYYSCDWLYLLELININEQGEIICI